MCWGLPLKYCAYYGFLHKRLNDTKIPGILRILNSRLRAQGTCVNSLVRGLQTGYRYSNVLLISLQPNHKAFTFLLIGSSSLPIICDSGADQTHGAVNEWGTCLSFILTGCGEHLLHPRQQQHQSRSGDKPESTQSLS